MGHYRGRMPDMEIPRTQSGICGEAFAVSAGLAEPPPAGLTYAKQRHFLLTGYLMPQRDIS